MLQPPKELDYFAPGYYSVAFRDPDGVPIEVAHRWEDLPDLPDAELVKVPGHGVTLGGYLFKPQAGKPPYPAVILLHGFAGHAFQLARAGASHRGQWLCGAGAVAARLARLGGRERPGPAPAARRAGRHRLAGPRGRWSTASGSGWSAPRWAARSRCSPPRTIRRSAPSPPILAPTDLARWREGNPFVRDYLDDLCGPEGLPVRSPILRVAQIDAPVLLIHGDSDENVSVQQTMAMAEALATATARTSKPSSCPAPPTISPSNRTPTPAAGCSISCAAISIGLSGPRITSDRRRAAARRPCAASAGRHVFHVGA